MRYRPVSNGSLMQMLRRIARNSSTNTLAAKTASMAGPQTMFEMCSETRRRLRRVHGYDRFIGEKRSSAHTSVDLGLPQDVPLCAACRIQNYQRVPRRWTSCNTYGSHSDSEHRSVTSSICSCPSSRTTPRCQSRSSFPTLTMKDPKETACMRGQRRRTA